MADNKSHRSVDHRDRLGVVLAMLLRSSSQAAAQAGAAHEHDLGEVRFGVSCAADVQPEFDQAVALRTLPSETTYWRPIFSIRALKRGSSRSGS